MQLAPQQPWRQRSHALLMQGRLHRSASRVPVATGQPAGAELRAPAVLPWLTAAAAQRGLAPAPPGGPAHAFTAGSSGALLLVCPEEPSEPPTPGSSGSVGSLGELGGSPFAAERPTAEEAEGQAAGAGGPALRPDGRPLHRVRSRRCELQRGRGWLGALAGLIKCFPLTWSPCSSHPRQAGRHGAARHLSLSVLPGEPRLCCCALTQPSLWSASELASASNLLLTTPNNGQEDIRQGEQ